jgi:hypothetical protein
VPSEPQDSTRWPSAAKTPPRTPPIPNRFNQSQFAQVPQVA